MHSSNLWIFGFLLLATASCAVQVEAAEKLESSPIGHTITPDGDPSDWDGAPLTSLEDSLHVMAIADDDLESRFVIQSALHLLAVFSLVVSAAIRGWFA